MGSASKYPKRPVAQPKPPKRTWGVVIVAVGLLLLGWMTFAAGKSVWKSTRMSVYKDRPGTPEYAEEQARIRSEAAAEAAEAAGGAVTCAGLARTAKRAADTAELKFDLSGKADPRAAGAALAAADAWSEKCR